MISFSPVSSTYKSSAKLETVKKTNISTVAFIFDDFYGKAKGRWALHYLDFKEEILADFDLGLPSVRELLVCLCLAQSA